MVSWFHPLHFWDNEMTIGFVVSFTPSLGQGNDKRFCGFIVSPTSSLRHRNDDMFHSFMVS